MPSENSLTLANTALQTTVQNALAVTANADAKSYAVGDPFVSVDALDQKHSEWTLYKETWDLLHVLYTGGTELRNNASLLLMERPKEPKEIFERRCQKVTYQNLFGTICAWYMANLFKQPPVIDLKDGDTTLNEKSAGEAGGIWEYYNQFESDCDRNGCSLSDYARDVLRQLMTFGSNYTLVDMPAAVKTASNRGEQTELMRPYLCSYDPRSVINWDRDDYGVLSWIVFYKETKEQVFLKASQTVRRWYYYDRTGYAAYEWREGDQSSSGVQLARLIDSGAHACSNFPNPDGTFGRVPVIETDCPDILNFGERTHLQCRQHFNIDNALDWGLMLGNLAQPVIKTNSEYTPTISETHYIKLRQGDSFEWAEPSGRTFQISQTRLAEIREEVYRSMYVLSQGRSSSATASASSGLSKQIDGAPATDIVNTFGSIIRLFLQTVLHVITVIREEDDRISADVRGLNVDDAEDLAATILNAEEMLKLDIPSETLRKEILKQLAAKYGKDWNKQLLDQIRKEIDAAPSLEEQQAAADQKSSDNMAKALSQSASVLVLGTPTPAQPPKD